MNTPADTPEKMDTDHLALRTPPRAVTRLNRRTLALVVGVLASALLGATVWSLQAQRRPAPSGQELHISDKVAQADTLDKIPRDYSEVPQLGAPRPGDWGAVSHDAAPQTQAEPAPRPAAPVQSQRSDRQAKPSKSPVRHWCSGHPTAVQTQSRSGPATPASRRRPSRCQTPLARCRPLPQRPPIPLRYRTSSSKSRHS